MRNATSVFKNLLSILSVIVCLSMAGSAPAEANDFVDGFGEGSRSLTLGGGVMVRPKYEGSDEHDVYGYPLIIPRLSDPNDQSLFAQFRRRVSVQGIDDIRFRAFDWSGFEIGPVAGYRPGRDQDDATRLLGLGDVDGGLAVGGYVGYRFANVLLDASATTQVTGDDTGLIVRLGAEVEHRLSPRLELTTRVGTTIASDDYAEAFFGISALQSAQSFANLPAYDASAGIKDVFVDVTANLDLTDKWLLQVGGRYARLVGDAADSPIVETEDQFFGRVGLGYKFSLDR